MSYALDKQDIDGIELLSTHQNMSPSLDKALKIILQLGGIIHTGEAIKSGINSKTLYELRDRGALEQLSRGVFRVIELDISNPDFVTVITRAPHAVICLISALSFHEITTQIPHQVDIAIARNARSPKIEWPPISAYRFSSDAFQAGIPEHNIDGVIVQIYSPEKTLADCFKYRNKIGLDVALEALQYYKERKKFKVDDIYKYSKICRVENVLLVVIDHMVLAHHVIAFTCNVSKFIFHIKR